jgi:hypothetical protein
MAQRQRSRGRESRDSRLSFNGPGVYVSASLEFLNIIKGQYKKSAQIDKNPLGINTIPLLTIPLLLSCLRILALEIENQKENLSRGDYESGLIRTLRASGDNDIMEILKYYNAPDELRTRMRALIEIRHEILHPAPFPEEGHPLPDYLKTLEAKSLLWKPPSEDFACNIYYYFRSHKLFDWSFDLIIEASRCIIESQPYPEHFKEFHRRNFYRKDYC